MPLFFCEDKTKSWPQAQLYPQFDLNCRVQLSAKLLNGIGTTYYRFLQTPSQRNFERFSWKFYFCSGYGWQKWQFCILSRTSFIEDEYKDFASQDWRHWRHVSDTWFQQYMHEFRVMKSIIHLCPSVKSPNQVQGASKWNSIQVVNSVACKSRLYHGLPGQKLDPENWM